jgi:hypothetical protein
MSRQGRTVTALICDRAGTTRLSNNGLVAGAIYELEPENAPGMRLDVAGGGSGPADAIIWGDSDGSNQRWRIVSVGGGIFRLQPQSGTSTVLDVDGAGTANGTNVSTYYDFNQSNQRWKLIDAGEDYYELEPQHAIGQRLTVSGGSRQYGANVDI